MTEKIVTNSFFSAQALVRHIQTFVDTSLTMIAFISAYFIKKYLLPEPLRGLTITPNYYIILLLIIIIWFLTFRFFRLYISFINKTLKEIIYNIIKAVAIGMILLTTFLYVLKIKDVSRILLGLFVIFDLILVILAHIITYRIWSR